LIVEIDNIELSFDNKKILHGIYLKAETGKVTGILGRNGSGKTSLLQILFGTLSAKYQNIRINNIHTGKKLYKTNTIAFLPQHQLLPNTLYIRKVFALFNVEWDDFIVTFESFKRHAKARVNEISSGELRVLETYLILCSNKEIILLDEPFSFIAPLYIEKFKTIISEKKQESTIIITDHFYKDILEISDTVYFLKNGSSKLIKTLNDLESEEYLNLNK
tara:strand:+ start:305 stop:961 length:657 start_codon:yes stop_codon:yes gene_type:complete